MKAALICPHAYPAVPLLEHRLPQILHTYFGRTLLDYWLEFLAVSGVSHVTLLAADHLELVRALVRNGERWGLKAEVVPEARRVTAAAARAEYRGNDPSEWLPEPHDFTVLDHFPGMPRYPLFQSYSGWFEALQQFLPRAARSCRIGVREPKPGVWVAAHAHVSPHARLLAPCWVGERVNIGPRCVIGPRAVVEDGAAVEADSEITSSVIGPHTYVGKWTEVRQSLAWGNSLLNLENGSFVIVPDPFILSSLSPVAPPPPQLPTPLRAQIASSLNRMKSDLQLLWRQLVMR
jgi:hypothetical protein